MSNTSPTLFNYNDFLNVREKGIAPVCGIPLIFISAAGPEFALNAINIYSATAENEQALVLWPFTGPADWNSIWQLTPEGYIVCPNVPEMVIGIAASGSLCILQKDNTDKTQRWIFQCFSHGYYTITSATGMTIEATAQCSLANGHYQQGTLSLVKLDGSTPSQQQLWIPLPAVAAPSNRFYIQSAMSGQPGQSSAPYVVTAESNGNNVFSSPWLPGNANQLWHFNADGTISNDFAETLALTCNSTSQTDSGDPVTLTNANGNPTDTQIWKYEPNFSYLTVYSPVAGTLSLNVPKSNTANALITYKGGGSNSEWYVFPEQSVLTGRWFYIQTQVNQNITTPTDPPGPEYVLTVADASPVSSTPVQINQLQPGALTQLWQLTAEGYLINALNPTLALSAYAQPDNNITLQSLGGSGWSQYWCLLPNGLIATQLGTQPIQYLSVEATLQEANAVLTNGEIIAYTYTDGILNKASTTIEGQPMAIWKIINYEPDLSGQWFTIQTANENKDNSIPYLLTANDNWSAIETMPPLGGNTLQHGTAAINQLWRYTLEGSIVSALNPGLYLSANSDNQVSLGVGQPGYGGQVWAWGETWQMFKIGKSKYHFQSAALLNVQQQMVLTAIQTAGIGNLSLQAAETPAQSPNQYWAMLPHNPVYNQPTTIRITGDDEAYPGLFLTLEEGTTGMGYNVAVSTRNGDPAYSTWQFIFPGYIVSSVNSDIALCMRTSVGSDPLNPVYGPGVAALLRSPIYQPFQLWEATLEGQLVNKHTGYTLAVVVDNMVKDTDIFTVAALPIDHLGDPGEKVILSYWDFSPGTALSTTLVMPPVPFPTAAAGTPEANAYDKISAKLGLKGGIRQQYQNLAAPLNTYLTAINMMLVVDSEETKSVDKSLRTVVKQLSEEITKIIAIQQFFAQANSFHQSLSQEQAMLVSELITVCAFPNGVSTPVKPKKKKGWIWDMCEGLLYAGLNAAGLLIDDPKLGEQASRGAKFIKNGLPVVANLISGSLTTTQAYLQDHSTPSSKWNATLQNIYNYELSVFQVQQSLLNLFETIGNIMGKMEMLILSDWGKISAVYDMIVNTDGIDSLYWPASLTPAQSKQMLSGYATKVLQTLIPSNASFYINGYLHNASGKGLQQDQVTFYGENMDNTHSQWVAVVNPDVMNLVWAYGTNPNDFYRQLNGWNLMVKYPFAPQGSNMVGNASLVITIYNMTSVPMTLHTYSVVQGINVGVRDIAPYSAQQIAAYVISDMYNNCYAPNGSFSVAENRTGGNEVLNGEIPYNQVSKGAFPAIGLNVNVNSPYYLIERRQSPAYIVDMDFQEIYIGSRGLNSGS